MKVYVVMSNDFPDSVYASEELAHIWCAEATEQNRKAVKQGIGRKIYYKLYSFDLVGVEEAEECP